MTKRQTGKRRLTESEVLGDEPNAAELAEAARLELEQRNDAAAAVVKDRLRVLSILESNEAKRDPAMAMRLALRTSIPADEALIVLSRSAVNNPYTAAMAREGEINIEASAANFAPADPDVARAVEIAEAAHSVNIANGTVAKGTPFDRAAATQKAIEATAVRKAKG